MLEEAGPGLVLLPRIKQADSAEGKHGQQAKARRNESNQGGAPGWVSAVGCQLSKARRGMKVGKGKGTADAENHSLGARQGPGSPGEARGASKGQRGLTGRYWRHSSMRKCSRGVQMC